MKIIFVGASSLAADSMEKHIVEVLATMGHEVRHFNIRDVVQIHPKVDRLTQFMLRNLVREPERLSEKKLLRALAEYQPDLVLVILGSILSPKTVSRMRKQFAGRIVCWCQDQLTTMGRQYLIGCEYDRLFVKDHYLVDMFSNYLGVDVHYLPEACNPVYHHSVTLSDSDRDRYKADIFTYGNIYYYRQTILEALQGYDLKVYGNMPDWLVNRLGDSFTGRCVFEEEKCKAVAGATIVLNTLHPGEIRGLNCRAFEMAGCGGFQLSSYSDAIAEHFVVGEEIEVFRNRAELLEKVDHYLDNPERARAIARAGQARAYAEHTYEHRLNRLFELSGLVA
jgi:spore maturation protein CgeB